MNKLILTKEELMRAAKVKYVCTDDALFYDYVGKIKEVNDKIKLDCCQVNDNDEVYYDYCVYFKPIDDERYECTHKKHRSSLRR